MEQKYRGLIAYLFNWISGLIILFAYKDNDSRTKFNACQAIVLGAIGNISSVALGFIPVVRYVGYLISALVFAACIIGMIKSYNEEDFEIPVISDLTRDLFKKQLD